jgi:hypothetical protein
VNGRDALTGVAALLVLMGAFAALFLVYVAAQAFLADGTRLVFGVLILFWPLVVVVLLGSVCLAWFLLGQR